MQERSRILVVDDDLFVRRPLQSILSNEGFDAVTAADGEECLASVSAAPPDLIIMDVVMPGLDGFEVCRKIKGESRYSSIPIILLSGRWQEADRARGLGLGAADYMKKPYSSVELLGRVHELLSQRRGLA